jgi:hypothetical protein
MASRDFDQLERDNTAATLVAPDCRGLNFW